MTESIRALFRSALVTVADGRGFVVEGPGARYVVTSANRLPFSPTHYVRVHPQFVKQEPLSNRLATMIRNMGAEPPKPRFPGRGPHRELLAALGEKSSVSAECLLLDPIGDLAILGPPTDGDPKEAEAYEAFTTSVLPLRVSDAGKSAELIHDDEYEDSDRFEVPVWMLYLNNKVFQCKAQYQPQVGQVRGQVGQVRRLPGTFGLHGGEIELPLGLGVTDAIPHYHSGLEKMLGTPVIVADGSVIGVMTGHRWGPLLTQHLPRWLLPKKKSKAR